MAIFQKSVIKKHLNNLDKEQVEKAYLKFKSNYNPKKIEQIKTLKEEEYQDGFLRDLFVDVFGYTLRPDENYNLQREFKNQSDGKKADGAIIDNNGINPIALAVIELKSTKTKDLTKVTQQAFNYKNNQPECKYVITSNFQKLRFYIDYANEYEEFDLFYLEKEDFELLYLLLNKKSIFDNIPLKIKEETKFHEQEVSSKLYKDYSNFKRKLYENLTKNHPANDKLTLFKKSQKLLDRFLFILFAEDSGLLPPNSISRVIETYHKLIELDAKKPLYDIFKQYFGYMNIGRKGKTSSDDIPAYNGGLFYTDDLLDNLKINDNILIDDLRNLSEYDFDTEIDVNILGHIFEHSLNEIEEITAEIEGKTTDKNKSKRKKDGVFYTPKYITQYIVENTIGTLCNEKRIDLKIEEIEFDGTFRTKTGKLSEKGKKLYNQLKEYKDWLISLKIIDPACGSGAFLNQALNFLIEEHKIIDDIIAELTNTPMRLFDVDKSILENNLFGVDINEESVEIAQLSLWLRTAQKGRKLSNLNNNIKCGNSLIDDPEIAGDKAFHWQTEFPQIFKEKNKKAYHITTAIHDSRTSARMIKHKVRERREMGTNPYPNIIYFTPKDDLLITNTIAQIVKEDNLNMLAYNICADHLHLLLVCDIDEVPRIMQKIKGRTSYIYKGLKPLAEIENKKPLWQQKYSAPKEITTQNQLQNTISYIQKNRSKHELPEHSKEIKLLIENMCIDFDTAIKPEYFGGFDCVIGNPPYVRQELFKEIKLFLKENYKCYNSVADLYTYFIEKGIGLMSERGKFSFILPNKFLKATYGKQIRKVIKDETNIELIFDFDDYPVFDDATTYPIVYVLNKKNIKSDFFIYSEINKRDNTNDPISLLEQKKHKVSYKSLTGDMWNFVNIEDQNILEKVNKNSKSLNDFVNKKIFRGLTTGRNEAFIINEEKRNELINLDAKNKERIKVLATGKEVKRNTFNFQDKYLLFTGYDDNIPQLYPDIQNELDLYKDALIKRYDKGENYWNLRACAYYEEMQMPKIIYPRINNRGNFYFDSKGEVFLLDNNFFISTNSKALLALLNSKLVFFYLKNICTTLQGGFYDFRRDKISTIPISNRFKTIDSELSKLSESLINSTDLFNKQKLNFTKLLQSKFDLEKVSKKLQNWQKLEFNNFLKELNKSKIKLNLNEESEWMQFFNEQKAETQTLKTEIGKTEKEIDQMVYKLYGLSDEEITVIENSY